MLPPTLTVANLGFSLAMMAGVEARKRGGGRVHRHVLGSMWCIGQQVADKSGMPGGAGTPCCTRIVRERQEPETRNDCFERDRRVRFGYLFFGLGGEGISKLAGKGLRQPQCSSRS